MIQTVLNYFKQHSITYQIGMMLLVTQYQLNIDVLVVIFHQKIEITNMNGIVSGGYEYGLLLARVAGIGTIGRVEVLDSGSTASNIGWVDLIHDSDNYWTNTSNYTWVPRFDVRITSSDGYVLNSSSVVTSMLGGAQFDFGQNFNVSISER